MNIKTAILSVLTACGSYALTAPCLKVEVQAHIGGMISKTAFSKSIAELKRDGRIGKRKQPVSGEACWFLKAA